MTAAILLLAVSMPRVVMPVQLAALGALLIGVAHSWILLLALAVPAAALVVVPLRRAAWRSTRRDRVLCAAVLLLTLAGLVQALAMLRPLSASEVLIIPGGITTPDAALMLALVLGSVAAVVMPHPGRSSRLPWVAAVPAVGLLAAAALAALQLSSSGELSYYFWKFVLGLTLVAVAVLAVGIVGRAPGAAQRAAPVGRTARRRTAVAVTAGCVALLQIHGLAGRSTGELQISADQRTRAADLLRAAETATAAGLTDAVYVRGDDAMHPVNAQQWLLALTSTWTMDADRRASGLIAAVTPAEVAALALENGGTLVVAPGDVPALGLGAAAADRIVTTG